MKYTFRSPDIIGKLASSISVDLREERGLIKEAEEHAEEEIDEDYTDKEQYRVFCRGLCGQRALLSKLLPPGDFYAELGSTTVDSQSDVLAIDSQEGGLTCIGNVIQLEKRGATYQFALGSAGITSLSINGKETSLWKEGKRKSPTAVLSERIKELAIAYAILEDAVEELRRMKNPDTSLEVIGDTIRGRRINSQALIANFGNFPGVRNGIISVIKKGRSAVIQGEIDYGVHTLPPNFRDRIFYLNKGSCIVGNLRLDALLPFEQPAARRSDLPARTETRIVALRPTRFTMVSMDPVRSDQDDRVRTLLRECLAGIKMQLDK